MTPCDAKGNELHTWRYAVEADADPAELARRMANDVAWILKAHPSVPVHCVQDAAPELARLPEALARALPTNANVVELVDFEHLMGYLAGVVDAARRPETLMIGRASIAACCSATTTPSTRSGANCVGSPHGCRAAVPMHARQSQPR